MKVDAGIITLATGVVLMLPVAVTDQKSLSGTLFVFAILISAFILSETVIFNDGYIGLRLEHLPFLFVTVIVVFLAFIVKRVGVIAKIPRYWYKICSIAVVFLVIGFTFLYLWFYNGENDGMIYEASEMLRGRWDDDFGTRRIYIWRNVWEGLQPSNILLGTGPDTLGYWNIEPFSRFNEELGITLIAPIDAAHNEYLHILATGGLLSLFSYLSALVYTFVQWFRSPNNHVAAVAGTGVLFYCIQAFFGISMPIAAPFFWVCLGVTINAQTRSENREENRVWQKGGK
jgi:O-antigen ligase